MHRRRTLVGATVLLWLVSSLVLGLSAFDAAHAQEQRCWELVSVHGDFKRLVEGDFEPLTEAAVADIPYNLTFDSSQQFIAYDDLNYRGILVFARAEWTAPPTVYCEGTDVTYAFALENLVPGAEDFDIARLSWQPGVGYARGAACSPTGQPVVRLGANQGAKREECTVQMLSGPSSPDGMPVWQASLHIGGLYATITYNYVPVDKQLHAAPVVYATLFHSPSCPYCRTVMSETLPALQQVYGDQLQVFYVDVSQAEGLALFQTAGYTLAPNDEHFGSVPTVIIGETILVGGREIAEQLPGLIRDGITAGGIDLSAVPGLREAYEAALENRISDGAVSGAVENAAAQPEASTSSDVPLTAQQEALLDDLGFPDAFDIIEMDGADGAAHRYETWRYFQQNTAFVFIDGEFRYDAWEPYPPGGVIAVTVSPDQFPLGIGKQAVINRFDSREWETFTNSALQESGLEFLVSEQIILGFENDRLVYVEAIALPAQEGAQ